MTETSGAKQPRPVRTGLAARHHLDDTIAALGLAAETAALSRLEAFIALLLRWNRIYNLSGARDEQSLVRDHLVDCLAIIPVIEARIQSDLQQGVPPLLIDVGSGAGFPGLVIAAIRPQWRIALVEPVSKKVAFLQQAVATLGLHEVRCIGLRLEASGASLRKASPDPIRSTWHFTSRAVAALSDLVALVTPLARPGSRLFAMRASPDDAQSLPIEVSVHTLHIPHSSKQRSITEVRLSPPGHACAVGDPAP